LTEDQFFRLAAICDRALLSADARPDWFSVPFLHVLRRHPVDLAQYAGIDDDTSPARKLRIHWSRQASLLRPLVAPVGRNAAWMEGLDATTGADVLIVSHLVSSTADPTRPDFYFGSLADDLAKQGVTSVTALIDHEPWTGTQRKQPYFRGGPAARVVLPRTLSLQQEVGLLRRALRTANEISAYGRKATDAHERETLREAARAAASSAMVSTLRIREAIGELCACMRPRMVLVTWEGHAWERSVFAIARERSPGVRCLGYQHTILQRHTHALKRSLGRQHDPDALLTIGEVTAAALQSAWDGHGVPVAVYGSHRRRDSVRPPASFSSGARRCLVVPEGLETECLSLIDFTLRAAREIRDLDFVIRMHPVLPFEQLRRRHPQIGDLPPNVSISKNADIEQDFADSTWVLYRGSSAVIHAVLAGKKPIYYRTPDDFGIDPLFSLDTWRTVVTTVGEFRDAMSAVAGNDSAGDCDYERAKAYCDGYVRSPRLENVLGWFTEPAGSDSNSVA
jgi:hypothetical protein